MASRFDPRTHGYDDHPRGAGMIYILMLVVALAFGGFIWQLYSGPDVPRIAAPAEPYKVAPPPEAATAPDTVEQGAFYDSIEGRQETTAATPRPAPEAVVDAPPAAGPPQLSATPQFVANGPFVAQLAALQSEQAAELAWRRFASRTR